MFMLRRSAGALSVRWRAVGPARSAAAGAEQQEGCCHRDRSLGAARSSALTLARVTGFWRTTHKLTADSGGCMRCLRSKTTPGVVLASVSYR